MIQNKTYQWIVNILLLVATLFILVYVIFFVYQKGYNFNAFMPLYVVWLVALLLKIRMDDKNRLQHRKRFLDADK